MFDEAGRFTGYRGVGRHMTERKRADLALRQSQAYLAEAQRLTHTGSWAYNPATGKVTDWSDEAFRIFGLDAHGGRISARPNSPHGAIFQFSLPLVSEDTGVA